MEKSHSNHSRICKICNKRFANGKAMGGHMRSHFAKLPLPPKPNPDPKSPPSYSSSSSMHSYHKSQNYHEQLITAITDHHHHHSAVMINDGDAGSDSARSSPMITRRRSKRRRKNTTDESVTRVAVAVQSPEHTSPDSEIILAEEVARNLISLSRGGSRSTRMEDLAVHGNELDEDDDESFVAIQERSRSTHTKRRSYRCDTCKKLFRSYHALGGHRSSHKKMKSEEEDKKGSGSGAVEVVARFKCPFCDKMFESGQALGGHKKVHFAYLAAPTPLVRNPKKYGGDCLDLNRLADELSDGEVSIATAIETAEADSSYYWS